ncbi:MAG: histidine kinase, partial [Muribaculaceae bacterium]|nr:histidine kinase [Muribaculaceae bacterium]
IEMSLYDQNTRQYASELEYRYMQDTTVLNSRVEAARKHEEVLRLRNLIWTCIAIALASLLALYIYAAYQSYRRRRLAEEMRASLLSMRLENTRNRISPHFVFNMLNNTLSEKSDSDRSGIEKFVSLIRRNLELAEKPVISLKEEIEFVDLYVNFLQHSHGSEFEYHKEISDTVNLSMLVPSMLIEIFIENAIKHGLRGYDGKRELWLNIIRQDKRTFITVANNGLMHSPANTRGTGTGTRIVSQTIQVLNERNDKKIEMMQSVKEYPEADGGKIYVVSISIPDDFDFSALYDKRLNIKK